MSSELCSLPSVLAAEAEGGKPWLEQFVSRVDEDNLLVLKDKV